MTFDDDLKEHLQFLFHNHKYIDACVKAGANFQDILKSYELIIKDRLDELK